MPIEDTLFQIPIEDTLFIFKILIFFKKVFVITHARENHGKHERENFGVQMVVILALAANDVP